MSYSSQCKGKLTFDGFARSRPASRRRPARHRRAAGGCARQGRPDRQAAHGATLTYDADSRLAQTTGSTTARFLYEGSQIVAEYNSSGVIQRRFVPGPAGDEPIVWYEGSGSSDRRWLLADRQGSVIAVANSAGTTIGINTYDESGIPASGDIGRFQYNGAPWIPEIGLYHMRARTYSPTLGRFMQSDPIGYSDGLNFYNYAHGDPVNGTDLSGLLGAQVDTKADGGDSDGDDGGDGGGGDGGNDGGGGDTGGGGSYFATSTPVPGVTVNANCQNNPNLYGCSPAPLNGQSMNGSPAGQSRDGGAGRDKPQSTTVPGVTVTAKKIANCTLSHYGLTIAGLGLSAAGSPVLPAGVKTAGTVAGTSPASAALRGLLDGRPSPFGINFKLRLPPTANQLGRFFQTGNIAIRTTEEIGTFAGRLVPFIGDALLTYDVVSISACVAGGG